MQDYVSTRWIRVVGLLASMSLLWALFIPYGFPWMGFAWVSLACSGALWLRKQSTSSIAQMIHDLEAEPARAVATPRGGRRAR